MRLCPHTPSPLNAISSTGVCYEVKTSESSTFASPDEVEALYPQANDKDGGGRTMVGETRMPGFSRGMEEDEVVAPKVGPNRNRVVEEGWDSTGKADGGGGGSKHSVADGHLMPIIACYKDNSETCVSSVGESVEDKEMGNMEVGLMAQSNLLTSKVFLAQKGVVDLASSDGPSVPFISEKALVAGASSTGDSGKDQEGNPYDGEGMEPKEIQPNSLLPEAEGTRGKMELESLQIW